MRIKEQRKRKKRRRIGICIFLVVLMLFALAALIVVKVFTVQNVVVEGNSLYSADQIKNMVLDDDYSWNSLYVDLKYRFVDVGEVPFVDTMEISLMIRIHCGFRLQKKVFWAVFILIRLDNMRTLIKTDLLWKLRRM